MESKVKPNLLLVIVKYGLDVVWYLSFVVIILVIAFSITKRNDPNVSFGVDVKYFGELKESYTSAYESITSSEFIPTRGTLSLKGELPLHIKVLACIFEFFVMSLFLTFLFYLRKIFSSFMRQSPFCMENVKRMRILSYCFVVFHLLLLANKWLFIPQIKAVASYNYYSTSIPGDFTYILIAIIIYIFADVFKYGVQLQEENNKFV